MDPEIVKTVETLKAQLDAHECSEPCTKEHLDDHDCIECDLPHPDSLSRSELYALLNLTPTQRALLRVTEDLNLTDSLTVERVLAALVGKTELDYEAV